jgi:hypothetical protein
VVALQLGPELVEHPQPGQRRALAGGTWLASQWISVGARSSHGPTGLVSAS